MNAEVLGSILLKDMFISYLLLSLAITQTLNLNIEKQKASKGFPRHSRQIRSIIVDYDIIFAD